MRPVRRRLYKNHWKNCRAPERECCGGKCLHKMNCNCPAGETVDIEYAQETIRTLRQQIRWWKARIAATEPQKTSQNPSQPRRRNGALKGQLIHRRISRGKTA